jgi:AbrB family looped-hinge helix DNA binding protein
MKIYSRKMAERGQITVPKALRDRFALGPRTEVEFATDGEVIVLRKKARGLNLDKWKGKAKKSFAKLGYRSVESYIESVRGR